MSTVDAKILDKKPICPNCEYKYQPGSYIEYGTTKNGFWFSFICETCSVKRTRVKVKYYVDNDFNLLEQGESNDNEAEATQAGTKR